MVDVSNFVWSNYHSLFHLLVNFAFRYAVVAKSIAYYFLPLAIIGILYALMARRLNVSARDMPGEFSLGPQHAQARARRHVARMVVAFVVGKHHVFHQHF